MGRRDRERRERIAAGHEEPIAKVGFLQRKAIGVLSRGAVVKELQQASTADQIDVLNTLVAGQRPDKLRRAIMRKAPGEMDKAIKKLQKDGEEVTVDSLCAEVKSTPGFLAMCERIGLNLEWFENLARERMSIRGL